MTPLSASPSDPNPPQPLSDRQVRRWRNLALLMVLPLAVVFLLFPDIDLRFSRLFLDAGGQFFPDTGAWHLWRQIVWDGTVFVALFALAMLVLGLLRGGRFLIRRRVWLFVVLSFLLGPGLLANGILKSFWGRARPQSVLEFGGAHHFTPPVLIAHECQHNCSFVSGEASGAFTLALVLGLLFLPRLSPAMRKAGFAILLGLAAWASLLRIMTGRHFLSDTLFAADFMAIIVFSLFLWLDVGRALRDISPRQIGRDLVAVLTPGPPRKPQERPK